MCQDLCKIYFNCFFLAPLLRHFAVACSLFDMQILPSPSDLRVNRKSFDLRVKTNSRKYLCVPMFELRNVSKKLCET